MGLRVCGESEIRSDTYLSPFDSNTVPPLKQDEITIRFVQFRPHLSVNRRFALVVTRYPEILRGYHTLSDIRHDGPEIVLNRGDRQEDRIHGCAHNGYVQQVYGRGLYADRKRKGGQAGGGSGAFGLRLRTSEYKRDIESITRSIFVVCA